MQRPIIYKNLATEIKKLKLRKRQAATLLNISPVQFSALLRGSYPMDKILSKDLNLLCVLTRTKPEYLYAEINNENQ